MFPLTLWHQAHGELLLPPPADHVDSCRRAGACRRVRVAKRFFQEMLHAGIKPDVQAMNSLINAFAKAGKPEEALKVRSLCHTSNGSNSSVTERDESRGASL